MDKKPLLTFLFRLGDDSLILGQRLSEWCGHGPILEEDIALTNTALDLIGQATNIYTYAAEVQGEGKDADALAFLRLEHQYFNAILTEQPNGNFADTIVRQFFFDTYRKGLFEHLVHSTDKDLSAIAEKSLKETRYHFKHSAEWVIRLGDGTEESKERTQLAVHSFWRYTQELFYTDETENALHLAGILPDISALRTPWLVTVEDVLRQATLQMPEDQGYFGKGRQGMHSEHMGFLLAQLQYMQRAYPNMKW